MTRCSGHVVYVRVSRWYPGLGLTGLTRFPRACLCDTSIEAGSLAELSCIAFVSGLKLMQAVCSECTKRRAALVILQSNNIRTSEGWISLLAASCPRWWQPWWLSGMMVWAEKATWVPKWRGLTVISISPWSLQRLISGWWGFQLHCDRGRKISQTAGARRIGFGYYTDLFWWNNINNQFCQLTTRVWYQRGMRGPYKCTGNHTYWGLKMHYDGSALRGNPGLHYPPLHGPLHTPDNNRWGVPPV